MPSRRGLFILALPAVALAGLLALALASRKPEDAAPSMPSTRRPAAPAPRAAAEPPAAPRPPRAAPTPMTPVSRDVLIATADEARLRGTYKNFRTAVAMGNTDLQMRLARSLMRDSAAARRIAEEAVAHARTEQDRTIARKTLDALRRLP